MNHTLTTSKPRSKSRIIAELAHNLQRRTGLPSVYLIIRPSITRLHLNRSLLYVLDNARACFDHVLDSEQQAGQLVANRSWAKQGIPTQFMQ